ncbi:hypothetical protein [Pseudoroseomonas ludipueritiae]|uniref:Uncharacterized protein n=1 Tax=Pseudoroseomonas ludipueritiae TaxID=198093 RepID=A0ABR7RB67_9PROT|nr:hypothetical protein [Pseudoroseomonas ludipueritiae]MBC9179079.1 hypothetical protein [Pseudoroseomonas ludipueritiae]
MVTRDVHLPPDLVERVLWLTGARTIQEVAEMAMNSVILHHMSAEHRGTGVAAGFRIRARLRRLAMSRRT